MASSSAHFSTETSLKGPRAMEVLDEAVSLIRQTPLSVLSIYYLGALPFCLGLIYFWFDMTQSADAESHLPGEALLLTVFYLWMKTCQAVFARKLLASLEGEADEWNLPRLMNTALLQTIYAGSFVIIYPLAVLIGLPFGWVNCFYHNISIVGTGPKSTVRSAYKEASDLAVLWPKQNHLIIAILLAATFVLFLNLAVFLIMVPELLNSLFGIETLFDQNIYAWNNSSFYLDVSVFCFLILNPLNKAVYALRYFYGRARRNGADLTSALRRYQANRPAKTATRAFALILALCVLGGEISTRADEKTATPTVQKNTPTDPSAFRLDQSIQKTLQKDEFAWRLPRPAASDEKEGWVARLVRNFFEFCRRILHTPAKWLGDFLRWLLERQHSDDSSSTLTSFSQVPWRLIILFFAVIVIGTLLYWLVVLLRRRAPHTLAPLTVTTVRTVDLEAEDVRADDLPEDSWLALAQQMIERGEMRLALRAFYLATLSVLAQQQLVRLGAAKSNRDYLQELTRRLRGNTSMVGFFRENVGLFEASWYGTHAVTSTMIETMRTNHHQMRSYAAP
jgi:hypothetical protein